MSFIDRHNTITVHTHLTQEGRKRLADGDLTISRIAFSDAEVNYGFGFNSGDTYSSFSAETYVPSLNNIVSVPYRRNGTISMNFDGTPPFDIDQGDVYGTTESISEPIPTLGFYSSTTNSNIMRDYRIRNDLALATGFTYTITTTDVSGTTDSFGRVGGSVNSYSFTLSGATDIPAEGLLFIKFVMKGGGTPTEFNGENIGYHANFFRYRYNSVNNLIYVDRALPQTFFTAAPEKNQPLWFYPLSGYSNYYGSGTTTPCPIWNMNILHRTQQIGFKKSVSNIFTETLHLLNTPWELVNRKHGSKSISGLLNSLGLNDLASCAILHYSNSYSGSVYGDSFAPGETVVDIPHILWHRNGNGINGLSNRGGLKLTDRGSPVQYDPTGNHPYTLLKDGMGPDAMTVGRVYLNKRIIAITDQELAIALEPRSNRNWTLPKMKLELVSSAPNALIAASGFTGIAQEGKRYYITYHLTSVAENSSRQYVPCAYIQSIDGASDANGLPMYIKGTFPPNSFPFMRTRIPTSGMSGTGWNSYIATLLVQEFDIEDDPGILNLDPFEWKRSTLDGSSSYTDLIVYAFTAIGLNSTSFYLTREEYDAHSINFTWGSQTNGTGLGQPLGENTGLWPGDIDFFFGNVTTQSVKKNYIRNVHFFLDANDLNTTTNPTYISGSTYISEILLLGNDNKILGAGKPDRPLEKNSGILIDMILKSYY